MRRYISALVLGLGLCLLAGTTSVLSQTFKTYEPFVPTPEWYSASRFEVMQQYDQAVDAFLALGAANPGTTLGAESLLEAAYWGGTRQSAIYQSIVSQYPHSRFALHAQLCLLNLQYGYRNMNGWANATDQLAQSYGAPALSAIEGGQNLSGLVAQVSALPAEIKDGLIPIYSELHGGLSIWLHRYDDAMGLALFERVTFSYDHAGATTALGDLAFDLQAKNPKAVLTPSARIDPTVEIRKPKPGQTKGPRPRISVEITVGNISIPQVDPSKIQFTLDGQDLRPIMVLHSQINRKLNPKKPLERLRVVARPTQRLTPGSHSVAMVIPTEGYTGQGPGIARANWTFYVRGDRDDPDDELDDDFDSPWDDD